MENKRYRVIIGILFVSLIFSLIVGVAFGSSYIEVDSVYKIIINKIVGREIFTSEWKKTAESIIWEIRVPRVILAGIVGGGLAICGILMQCITKNPIADPYILGISSGASTGAVFMMLVGGNLLSNIGVIGGAFIGAIFCGIFVFFVGTNNGKDVSTLRLILTGLAVSTTFSAFTNFMIYSARNSNQVRSAVFWSLGSLGRAKWSELSIPFITIVIILVFSLLLSKTLDLLLLGDTTAKMLGVNLASIKSILILLSTLVVSILVSMAGTIGFIGLLIPHICRFFSGNSHKRLLILSFLVGSIFLIWCDIFARVVIAPKEIPIGIITSMIGGPFFLFLILKNNFSIGGKR